MEITGKCTVVLPIESGTSRTVNAWQKQNFVIEVQNGRYSTKLCFQLFGDKVNECPAINDEVKVSFDIDSREYNGRWYTQLSAWKVERKNVPQPATQSQPAQPPTAQGDDLPF